MAQGNDRPTDEILQGRDMPILWAHNGPAGLQRAVSCDARPHLSEVKNEADKPHLRCKHRLGLQRLQRQKARHASGGMARLHGSQPRVVEVTRAPAPNVRTE
jgi:hypothetical protein